MKINKKFSIVFLMLATFVLNVTIVFAAPKTSRVAPSAPTGLTATATTSDVALSWTATSNTTGYKVYRAITNDSNYSLIATISTNSYKNTALTAGNKYWYYVQAYNSYGTSPASTHINITTQQLPVITNTKTVLGFTTYYYSGDTSSYNSLTANSSLIDEIATETFVTDTTGNITGLVPTNQLTYANNNGKTTLAMVTNKFDGNIAKAVLESPTNRQNLINNILNSLKLNDYKGVNIDLEGVFYYDRSYYTAFMNELYATLKPQGFIVTVAVPAKTSDSPTNTWSGAYDYAQLANYADQVVLMTYDEHYPGGTAGAVASIGWVENVIKYAVTVIPREKILLGTPAYGYDWSSNGTKAYSINGMYNLAATNNAIVLWDSVSKTPYFNYTDASGIAHSAWFENGTSLSYKLNLVNSYNLGGIGIWRLGLENADYWTNIKTAFTR